MNIPTQPAELLARLACVCKHLLILVSFGLLVGCNPQAPNQNLPEQYAPDIVVQDLDIAVGQTIYVPAYSKVYASPRGQTLDLTVTLSIHNTDTDHPIVVTSVRYFDAQGLFIKEFLPNSFQLPPLGTADFYVDDQTAPTVGLGANFIVEWGAEQPVYEPIVEAIMIHAGSTQGISFLSPGRVISQRLSEGE